MKGDDITLGTNEPNKHEPTLEQEEAAVPEEVAETEASPAEGPAKSELELLQEQFHQLQDQHLRLMAEYDNYRKRTQREKDEIYQNAKADTLIKLLPVQDNFERAMEFEPQTEEFAKGFELIEKGFLDVMTSFGVETFGEVGDEFNPEMHHAVMHIEDEAFGENIVSQVLQKGYRMGDRILRYAMVQTAN